MSTTTKGKRAEARVKAIMAQMGYKLVSEARRNGFWAGGQIGGTWQHRSGNTDLLEGAIDLVHGHPNGPFVLSQVCHIGGESPRRVKLRATAKALHKPHRVILLWAWDAAKKEFRIYREEDDFYELGWRMTKDSLFWPWALRQEKLA